MNIVVFGTGGVGGYFGAKLYKAGFKVTFIARGKQLAAIKKNGLQIKSVNGGFTIYPEVTDAINSLTSPDLILLGVKSAITGIPCCINTNILPELDLFFIRKK